MKFTAIKSNLTEALQVVQKAMSSKNALPILSGIYISVKDDFLQLSATDMMLRIDATVPVESIENGETVVPGRSFSELVRRLPDERIVFENISENGEDRMSIYYGDSKASMNGWPGRDYPSLAPVDHAKVLVMKGSDLKKAISLTAFTVKPDEIRPVFTGLLFEVKEDVFTIVGTDSFRLALYRGHLENKENTTFDIIIPVRAFAEVARLLNDDDSLEMHVFEDRVVFYLNNIIITANLIRGEYPPYSRVIPSGYASYVQINRQNFLASMERATLFSKEKDGTSVVNFALENSMLHIHTEGEYGHVNEHISLYHEGESVDITFNANFIQDALKAMKFEELEIHFNGSLGPGIMKPKGGKEDYLYLVLPLRR